VPSWHSSLLVHAPTASKRLWSLKWCACARRVQAVRQVATVVLACVDRDARVLSSPPPPRRARRRSMACARPSRACRPLCRIASALPRRTRRGRALPPAFPSTRSWALLGAPAVRRILGRGRCVANARAPVARSSWCRHPLRRCGSAVSALVLNACVLYHTLGIDALVVAVRLARAPGLFAVRWLALVRLYSPFLIRCPTLRAPPHQLFSSTRLCSPTGLLQELVLPDWCRVTSPGRSPPLRALSLGSEFRTSAFLTDSW